MNKKTINLNYLYNYNLIYFFPKNKKLKKFVIFNIKIFKNYKQKKNYNL